VRVKPLREASIRELRPLLDEEVAHWEAELSWSFGEVRAALAGGIERRTLAGRVATDGLRAAAYSYYMIDAGRAIVGSIFACREHRGRGLEEGLVDAVIKDARSERASLITASTRPSSSPSPRCSRPAKMEPTFARPASIM